MPIPNKSQIKLIRSKLPVKGGLLLSIYVFSNGVSFVFV